MTEHFWSTSQISEYLGITRGAVDGLRLPEPDVIVGKTRGWRPDTIRDWNDQRPGMGWRKGQSKYTHPED